MNRRMPNVKRFVKNKKKKAQSLNTGIKDLQREKEAILEISKDLLSLFTEIKEKTRLHSNENALVQKMNQKIDVIKGILINEENKTKSQMLNLKTMEENLAEFVYVTIDELNQMTKESRSLVQELQKKII